MLRRNIVAGRNPVMEALLSEKPLDRILLHRNASGDVIDQICKAARQRQVPIQYVPSEKLASLTQVQHQGVIALLASVTYSDLETVIAEVTAKNQAPLFVMLDGVTDVRNIGAIARTALCCGAQVLIVPDKGVGALNEDAVKSSAGALERLAVCRVTSLLKAVDTLHQHGIAVFASAMKAETALSGVNWKEPCCIVMGSEDKGIQPYMAKAADTRFSIPMAGQFDSLNVSVAAGIILYAAMSARM